MKSVKVLIYWLKRRRLCLITSNKCQTPLKPNYKNLRDNVAKKTFDIDMDISLKNYNNSEELSSTKKNKLSRFYIDLNGEIQEKGENLWGLFSGVTKYTTHSLSRNDNSENKMFGTYGKRESHIQ